jgi:WD40 repeat protein
MSFGASRRGVVGAFLRALRLEAGMLGRHPDLMWQQLANRLQWEGPAVQAVLAPGLGKRPWMRLRTRPRDSGLVRIVEAGGDWMSDCDMSADGALAVSAAADRTIELWDVGRGSLVRELEGLAAAAIGCAISREGALVAAVGADGGLCLWTADGSLLNSVEGHERSANACAFMHDGRALVSGGSDGAVTLWAIRPFAELWRVAAHTGPVTTCAASPDGSFVASGSWDRTICILSPDGRRMGVLDHPSSVIACDIADGGRVLAAGCGDGQVLVWDVAAGSRIADFNTGAQVNGCAMSADGRRLATAGADARIRLWDLERKSSTGSLVGHAGDVIGCALSDDGTRLVSVGADRTLRVWDPDAAQEAIANGHDDVVWGCAFAPRGLLVSAGSEGSVLAWDVATMESRGVLGQHEGVASACAVSADGRLAVSAGEDGVAQVHDLTGKVATIRLSGHQGAISACAFGPTGGWVITAGEDGTYRIWSLPQGEQRAVLESEAGPVWELALPADAAYAVGAHEDGSVVV